VNGLIRTVEVEYRLFRQPRKIGDVFECANTLFIILGIQKFRIWGQHLTLWYTCQDLIKTDFISKKKAYKLPFQLEFEAKYKFDDERLNRLEPGRLIYNKEEAYKIQEYTEIAIESTDIKVSLIACPVYPLDRTETRAKYVSEKRKKLKLEVF
jgi:hypothetical protein